MTDRPEPRSWHNGFSPELEDNLDLIMPGWREMTQEAYHNACLGTIAVGVTAIFNQQSNRPLDLKDLSDVQ